MSTTQFLSAPPREHRPGVGPMLRGACLGFLAGLGFGGLTAVVVFWSAGELLVGGTSADEVLQLAMIVVVAAVVGGAYGAVVGLVAGIGGVIAPRRGLGRRVAVTVATLVVAGATVAALAAWGGDVSLVWIGLIYLPPMGVAAWLIAPFLDGQGPSAR